MTRALLPIATLAAVYLLGNAIAAADWLDAGLLGALVCGGIYGLARSATPGASAAAAVPETRPTAADVRATGEGL